MEQTYNDSKDPRTYIYARILMYHPETAELLDFEKCVIAEDAITIRPPVKENNAVNTAHDANEESIGVYIVQNGRKIHAIASLNKVEVYLRHYPLALVLAKLVWGEKGCFLRKPDVVTEQKHLEKCYRVINSHLYRKAFGLKAARKRVAHAIKEGDRIKLGRATLVVRHLARKPAHSLSYIHNFMSQDTADSVTGDICVEDARETEPPTNTLENTPMGLILDTEVTNRSLSDLSTVIDHTSAPNTHRTNVAMPSPRFARVAEKSATEPNMCRICLEGDESGTLVVPCKCNGSMKYVHLACVRTWVQGRLNVKDERGKPQIAFFLKNLKCELCGVPYPSYLDVDSVWTEFLGIEEPQPPYAILEPENAVNTGLHVATLSTSSVDIGRNGASGIVIQDISVSRCHATLHYRDGHFIIEDRKSKFGTLLQLGDEYEIPIEKGAPIALKIGTDVLCIEAKARRNLAELCCADFSRKSISVVL